MPVLYRDGEIVWCSNYEKTYAKLGVIVDVDVLKLVQLDFTNPTGYTYSCDFSL